MTEGCGSGAEVGKNGVRFVQEGGGGAGGGGDTVQIPGD